MGIESGSIQLGHFIHSMNKAFAIFKYVENENDQSTYFEHIQSNVLFEQVFGVSQQILCESTLDSLLQLVNFPNYSLIQKAYQANETFCFETNTIPEDYRVNMFIPEPGFIAIQFENITEYSTKSNSLYELDKLINTAFENNPAILMFVNKQRQVIHSNRTTVSLYKNPYLVLNIGDIISCNSVDNTNHICGSSANCRLCTINSLVTQVLKTTKSVKNKEVVIEGDTGQQVYEANIIHILWESSPLLFISLIDITSRKKLEKGLINQQTELQEKNESLEALNAKYEQVNTDLNTQYSKLTEVEEKYRKLFENAQAALFRLSLDGEKMLVCNDVLANILGYPSIEKCILGYKPQKHYANIKDRYKVRMLLLKKGEINNYCLQFKSCKGEVIWVEMSAKAYFEKGYIEGAAMNITELKKAELYLAQNQAQLELKNREYEKVNSLLKKESEKLKRAKLQAEQSDKLKSAFLSNISHEVRTPLSGITGFVSLLELDLLPENFNRYKDLIFQSSQQLLSIINNIVDISIIDSGIEDVNLQEFDCSITILKLYDKYKKINKNEDLSFSFHFNEDNIIIYSDDSKLFQILDSLLDNAFKYTPKGSIEFGYKVQGEAATFYVKDTGIGIASKYFEDIFNKFFKIECSLERKTGGNGIGLALVKGYADMLKTKINIESNLDIGSCFSFTLPIKEKKIDNSNATTSLDDLNLSSKTILIVEDNMLNQILLSTLVGKTKANIKVVADGQYAIDYIEENKVDLILMDLNLPVVDGYEASQIIKKKQTNLPIIAQTAYVLPEDLKRIDKSHFDGLIVKPFEENLLAQILKDNLC